MTDTAPLTTETDGRLVELLDRLTLDEKVLILTGRDFWTTWPLEKIGLRRMLVSDGPAGVRGEVWDERSPSLSLPSGTALGAAWDPSIARRYGNVAAVEARRKDVDVVLGPTINLHRSPLGGRHFECLSEDPVLTARLGAAYVLGVQENGVGSSPKHFVANDFETDRFTVDVQVSDRALRELYLFAFEQAITDAKAWLVMSSYNSVNGVTATENELLETPLNSEWGFDGVVISDWTAVRSLASASASQDLVMPGPIGPWGDALVAAVRAGTVDESTVDRKVLRILTLAARVGALEGFAPAVATPVVVEDGIAFAREAEIAASVLVRNVDAELPWAPEELTTVAVIGHNAKYARTQGGGSATVLPEYTVSPLDGLVAALPGAEVVYAAGAIVQEGIAEIPLAQMTNPVTGQPGARVRFLDADGAELFAEDRRSTTLVYFGGDAPVTTAHRIEVSLRYLPQVTEQVLMGFSGVGKGRIHLDGVLLKEEDVAPSGTDLGAAFLSPRTSSTPVSLTAGVAVDFTVEFELRHGGSLDGILMLEVGIEPDTSDPDGLIAAAVEVARNADVALVVVGTNARVESEGFDRTSLALPGRQDDLVRAVAAVNPRTVVVVNAGSPVLLPWRDDVSAVLLSWFGGQEYGHAVADILTGFAEPGGRMPTSWPAEESDVPVLDVTPVDGAVRYDEGIHIGYRAWLKAGAVPAFEFGSGLGYTDFELAELVVPAIATPGEVLDATVSVTNTGARAGKAVVQLYAERARSSVDRPVRWLVGFAAVQVPAGETVVAHLDVPARLFADWADDGWHYEPGDFLLRAGTSVGRLPLSATVALGSVEGGVA